MGSSCRTTVKYVIAALLPMIRINSYTKLTHTLMAVLMLTCGQDVRGTLTPDIRDIQANTPQGLTIFDDSRAHDPCEVRERQFT
jgi:hypothetical protein